MARRVRANKSLIKQRYQVAKVAFPDDADLARSLGVHRSAVVRWKRGEAPAPPKLRAARRPGRRSVAAGRVLEVASIAKWLRGLNAHLGERRPIDVIRQGRLSEVVRSRSRLKRPAPSPDGLACYFRGTPPASPANARFPPATSIPAKVPAASTWTASSSSTSPRPRRPCRRRKVAALPRPEDRPQGPDRVGQAAGARSNCQFGEKSGWPISAIPRCS